MSRPYYTDDTVTLWHGDSLELLPTLKPTADICITDPPYAETSLSWDRWPKNWPSLVAQTLPTTTTLWCFGSLRMLLERRDEFHDWKLAQDIVWAKPRIRGPATDRFARVHEYVVHWYRGTWGELHKEVPKTAATGSVVTSRRHIEANDGTKVRPIRGLAADYEDDGTRLMKSIIPGSAGDPRLVLHPTQKPIEVLDPLIRYSCPIGGTVLDPFAGSGSTLVAARAAGRKAVGIEASERFCEVIAKRLAQGTLDLWRSGVTDIGKITH